MLVFDGFKSPVVAASFATAVVVTYNLCVSVVPNSENEMLEEYPYEIDTPCVLVERSLPDFEKRIKSMAKSFGANFAGT